MVGMIHLRNRVISIAALPLSWGNITRAGGRLPVVVDVDDLTDVRPETRAGHHTAGRVVSLVMQGTRQ